MKKNVGFGIAAALGIAVMFGACYSEIEPAPREPGGLLPIAGAYNVRDIGGYKTADGTQHVKSGKLIRSGDLNLLTARDKDYLFGTMGIKTVVDFRSEKKVVNSDLSVSTERGSSPDRLAGGVTVATGTAIDESVVVPDYESIISDTTNYPNATSVIESVKRGYARIVCGDSTEGNARAQYTAFFRTLLDESKAPVLYHCSAGKDRTGVATALLLSVLGVSREDVIADYVASAEYVAEKYYPVVPYVVENTKENMLKRRQLAQALSIGGTAAARAEESLIASTTNTIKQRTMQSRMNAGDDEATAKAAAEAYALSPGGQTAIAGAVTQTKNGIAPLASMTDAAIEAYAQSGGEKVRPLLTVKREYIEAAFAAIENPSNPNFTTVEGYLTTATTSGGLGLTAADITKLKSLYLE